MSLLFADSFDGIIAGASKWDTWHANNQLHTDYGRHGTKGVGSPTTAGQIFGKFISPATNRVTVGAWSYVEGRNPADNHAILRMLGATGSITLLQHATLPLYLIAGTGITTTPIGEMGDGQAFQWQFVELMWEPGVAAEVRVNGRQIWTGTPGGTGAPSAVEATQGTGIGGRPRQRFDDLYVVDSSGSINNDFLGPIKIANVKPDGAGNRTELDPTPAGDNWENVSDGDDETYVEGDPGDGDLYTFGDLPSSDDIHGAVQFWRAFDSEGGAITGRAIARVDGTEYDGDDQTMPGSVVTHVQSWDVNPDTGQPWTPAEVDAAEFGVEFDT